MKILAQFGIFIRIIILNIGGKRAQTQLIFQHSFQSSFYLWKNSLHEQQQYSPSLAIYLRFQ